MRTTTAITAVAVLAAALTACSDAGEKSAEVSPSASVSKEDRFRLAVEDADLSSWDTAAPSDGELMALPPKWCSALDEGHGVAYLLDGDLYPIGGSWGTKKPDANRLLVLAVTEYCPKYRDQVTQELRDSGEY